MTLRYNDFGKPLSVGDCLSVEALISDSKQSMNEVRVDFLILDDHSHVAQARRLEGSRYIKPLTRDRTVQNTCCIGEMRGIKIMHRED